MVVRTEGNLANDGLADGKKPNGPVRELLRGDDDIFRSSLFDAARMLSEGSPAPAPLRTVVVRELGECVRDVPYPALQETALESLGRIGGPVVANILASLSTTTTLALQVRHRALRELRRVGPDEGLAANLARDEDIAYHPILAVELAWLLAERGSAANAAELLLRVARYRIFTNDATKRLGACCRNVELPGLYAGLLALLHEVGLSREHQTSLARLLFVVSPAPPISEIIAILSDKQIDAVIRRDLAEVVGQIENSALPEMLVDLIRRPTIHAGVRARLALTVGSLRKSEMADIIVNLLSDTTLDVGLRSRLASALGPLKPTRLASRITEMICDEELPVSIRRSLARAIGSFDDPTLAHGIRKALLERELDIGIQARLARSLAALGDDEGAISLMNRLVRDRSFSTLVRARIVRELEALNRPEVTTILRDLLAETPRNGPLRREIIVGLVRAGDRAVVDELVQRIRRRDLPSRVRREMVESLPHLGGTGRHVLLDLLVDRRLDGQVRQAVAESLTPLCGPDEIAHIISIVEDVRQDLAVRVDSGRVLGALGETPQAVRALTRLLSEVSNRYGPVYAALFSVCRRTGAKVLPHAVGWPPIRYLS